MSRADDALRWLDARHLKLRGLDRRTRWAAIVGLVTAAIAAVVMIITSLGGPTLASKPCHSAGPDSVRRSVRPAWRSGALRSVWC